MNIPELVKLIDSIQIDIKWYVSHNKTKEHIGLLRQAKMSLASASVNLEAYELAQKGTKHENNKHKR